MSGITVAVDSGTNTIRGVEVDLDGHHVRDIIGGDHAGFDTPVEGYAAARADDQIEVEVEPTGGATPEVTPRLGAGGDLIAVYIQLGRYEVTALERAGLTEFSDPLRGISVAVSAVGDA